MQKLVQLSKINFRLSLFHCSIGTIILYNGHRNTVVTGSHAANF